MATWEKNLHWSFFSPYKVSSVWESFKVNFLIQMEKPIYPSYLVRSIVNSNGNGAFFAYVLDENHSDTEELNIHTVRTLRSEKSETLHEMNMTD